MATSTLRIGDRVVLSSVGGAAEVEYALFDPGEIELAATGPGMVQEIGYQTTAEDAIQRLKDSGITWPLVLETASAMQPTLAMGYARGPAVRRIANSLGPAELFDGFRFDSANREYDGRWLDLPALGLDLGLARFTQTAQIMHLLALLQEVTPGDAVRLVTRELMTGTRPGSRSFRRGTVPPTADMADKLHAFATQLRDSRETSHMDRASGPTAPELLEILRDRIVLSPDPESQDRLRAIEKAIGIRQRPMRGPLADPELWALDEQLSSARLEGTVELIDALERARGKQPATAYLRIRAAFIGGREDPRAIAERIASLALSMPSFVELELLAAEAWSSAGDPKRALPFARDLISNASVNDELRVRESQQFAAMRPSQMSMDSVRAPPRGRTLAMDAEAEIPKPRPAPRVTPALDWSADAEPRGTLVPDSPISAPVTPHPTELAEREARRRLPTQAGPTPSGGQSAIKTARPLRPRPSTAPPPPVVPPLPLPASSRKDTPPMMFGVTDPSARPPGPVPTSRSPNAPPKRPISGTWVGPPPQGPTGNTVRTSHFAAPPPPPTPVPPSDRIVPSQPPRASEKRPPSQPQMSAISTRATNRPPVEAPRMANRTLSDLMRGASQPPFRSDSPEAHVHVPRAPAVPRFDDGAEGATALALPDGLSGVPDPVEALPRTVLDARVQFTFLARSLGREYEEQLGIQLRADISGVEAMQRVLLERYQTRSVTTPDAAADVRRHGAFLSEILARTFGAFWVDIGPSDVGYWAMVVPPSTRVWPFGRILRLIAMQHNERDLVSYFLELQARANASR